MHTELRNRLGEPVADMLMEHLPPSSWSDMVQKPDVEHLRNEVNKRLDSLVHGVWAAVGIFSGAFIALFSLIATTV